MQILKKEVKDAILDAGIQEFYEKGFLGASMRSISSQANVSVGNVYRYFRNKEALFDEIAKPLVKELEFLFTPKKDEEGQSLNLAKALEILKSEFINILVHNRKIVIILYDRSEGTPYALFKEQWKRSISFLFANYINVYNQKFLTNPFDKRIAMSAATSFLEGIMQIVREFESVEDIRSLTLEFIRLYFYWSISTESR